jgi:hypothetical protein
MGSLTEDSFTDRSFTEGGELGDGTSALDLVLGSGAEEEASTLSQHTGSASDQQHNGAAPCYNQDYQPVGDTDLLDTEPRTGAVATDEDEDDPPPEADSSSPLSAPQIAPTSGSIWRELRKACSSFVPPDMREHICRNTAIRPYKCDKMNLKEKGGATTGAIRVYIHSCGFSSVSGVAGVALCQELLPVMSVPCRRMLAMTLALNKRPRNSSCCEDA